MTRHWIFSVLLFGGALGVYTLITLLAQRARKNPALGFLATCLMWAYCVLTTLLGGFLWLMRTFVPEKAHLLTGVPESFLAIGVLSSLVMWRPVRVQLARIMPLSPDSMPQRYGLVFAILCATASVGLLVMLDRAKLLSLVKSSELLWGTIGTELMLVLLALIGIGWLHTRNTRESLDRLGFQPISLREFWLCGAYAVGMLIAMLVFNNYVLKTFWPESFAFQKELMAAQPLGNTLGNPYAEGLVIAVSAGLGEEVFFRGLIQPVLGIGPTALLFTLIHYQYGISPAMLVVYAMGCFMGWLRLRHNTTFTLVTHVLYDVMALALAAIGVEIGKQ